MADFNDFGLKVGEYNSSLPTLGDGCPSELQLDESGRLIISGRYLEDSAHTSGDAGIFTLAVRNDVEGSLVDADGDYAPLQVDALGRLRVITDIDNVNIDFNSEKVEDSAHASGDTGSYILAVRADARPTDANTSADGDYASFFVNGSGELYVKDTDALAKLTDIETVLNSIDSDSTAIISELQDINTELDAIKVDTGAIAVDVAAIEVELLDQGTTLDGIKTDTAAIVVDLAAIEAELLDQGTTLDNIETEVVDQGTTLDSIESEIQSITHDEDSAHTSGNAGVMSLAVRNDANTSLVDADGDYAPLQVDENGLLKVSVEADSSSSGSESFNTTDDLAQGGDGIATGIDETFTDVTSIAVGAGETLNIYGWSWDADNQADARLIIDNGTPGQEVVLKRQLNSTAMPGRSEHYSDGGRIEVAGSATTSVKIQVRKRNANCPDINATGSIHARK
jgi:hypothetical protein